MNEELINQIVRRILTEPAFQALLQGKAESNKPVKSAGLVLLNYVPDFERTLTAVKQRLGAEYTLNILASESVWAAKPDLPEGMNWITPQDALGKADWQKILIPACSPNTLAKAALGLRDNPICEIIGRGLSQGIPIELITERLGFTAQTPQAYRELYEGYLKKLQSYGVSVSATLDEVGSLIEGKDKDRNKDRNKVWDLEDRDKDQERDEEEQGKEAQRTAAPEREVPKQDVIHYAKKYLADKDVYGLPEGSLILVKPLTVISPLARDTLKMRRIELRQEREGSR
jgi:hypothetical protein